MAESLNRNMLRDIIVGAILMKCLLIFIPLFVTLILSGCSEDAIGKAAEVIKTCKMVDVQHSATIEYTEPMQYTDTITKHTTLQGLEVWAVGEVTIKNIDTETGTFTVSQTFIFDRQSETKTSTQEIQPGESKVFLEEIKIMSQDFNVEYTVQAPMKNTTRTLTRYNMEQVCE
jgi:hypothetical protein